VLVMHSDGSYDAGWLSENAHQYRGSGGGLTSGICGATTGKEFPLFTVKYAVSIGKRSSAHI
jgi:hypothetical protein